MYHCKDFEIKSVRIGSRLQGGKEYAYRIVYNGKCGDSIYYTKEAARKSISKVVKILNGNAQ